MALPDGDHDDEGDGVMDGSAKRIMSGTMLAYHVCKTLLALTLAFSRGCASHTYKECA